MGHFWASFCEHMRDCGRNATLFLFTLAGFCAVLALLIALYVSGYYRYVLPAVPFLVLAAIVRFVINFRRARAERRRRAGVGPLSDLELRRARSKLQKRRTGLPAGPRVP